MKAVPPATNTPSDKYLLSAFGAWVEDVLAFLAITSVGFER